MIYNLAPWICGTKIYLQECYGWIVVELRNKHNKEAPVSTSSRCYWPAVQFYKQDVVSNRLYSVYMVIVSVTRAEEQRKLTTQRRPEPVDLMRSQRRQPPSLSSQPRAPSSALPFLLLQTQNSHPMCVQGRNRAAGHESP